jgi:hypothetical protein
MTTPNLTPPNPAAEGPETTAASAPVAKKTNGGDKTSATPVTPWKPKSQSYEDLCKEVKNAPPSLIEGFIPQRSVCIFYGDSGLGKTPFLAQLGLCVAAGIPFLEMETQKAIVLYLDYENSAEGYAGLMRKLMGFLKMDAVPDSFRRLPCPEENTIIAEIAGLRTLFPGLPVLVIADSMRGFDGNAEIRSDSTMKMLTKLERWAQNHQCATILIHHLRKDNDEKPPPNLDETDLMEWSNSLAGVRALINQTTVRIGIDNAHKLKSQAELIIKANYKIKGDLGPWYLRRVREEGDPIGYERVTGLALISVGQQEIFANLPDTFRFGDLEKASHQQPKEVSVWLRAWQCASLVTRSGNGKDRRYHKDLMAANIADADAKVKAEKRAEKDKVKQHNEANHKAREAASTKIIAHMRDLKTNDQFTLNDAITIIGSEKHAKGFFANANWCLQSGFKGDDPLRAAIIDGIWIAEVEQNTYRKVDAPVRKL